MSANAQQYTSLMEGVDEIRNRHIAAVNAGDATGATNLFAADAVFLPPGQPAQRETAAIQGWFTYVFGQFSLQGFGLQPGGMEQHGDLVIEHGDWQASFHPKDGSASMAAGGTYLTVYGRMADGSVRVIRDTFNGLPG